MKVVFIAEELNGLKDLNAMTKLVNTKLGKNVALLHNIFSHRNKTEYYAILASDNNAEKVFEMGMDIINDYEMKDLFFYDENGKKKSAEQTKIQKKK